MSSRLTKKSLVSVPGRSVKTPCFDPPCWRRAPACRRPAPSSPARSASAAAPCRPAVPRPRRVVALEVVAEPVGDRLQHGEAFGVGLLLGRIGAARRERHLTSWPPACRLLDRRAAGQHDQVGQRDLLAAGLRSLNSAWMPSSVQHLGQLLGLVDLPVLLRREADARAVGAAALVGAAEGRGRGPGGRDQLGPDRPEARILPSARRCRRVDQRVIDGGTGSCQIRSSAGTSARDSATFGPMSRWVSLNQARAKASANSSGFSWKRARSSRRSGPSHRHVGGGHHRRCFLDGSWASGAMSSSSSPWRPLPGAGGALGQLPLVFEQHVEIAHVPLVGFGVQAPSMPLVMVSPPLPLP
jgi:hypothetical protein